MLFEFPSLVSFLLLKSVYLCLRSEESANQVKKSRQKNAVEAGDVEALEILSTKLPPQRRYSYATRASSIWNLRY